MWNQFLRFGLVGALATVVHMVIGILLICSNWPPVLANTIAFVIAFMISFIGHLGFSFADQDLKLARSLWRFSIVGILGFCINQFILAALIFIGTFTDPTALFISTGSVAILTFVLSRVWAFRGPKEYLFDPSRTLSE